jgi:hypothetical protein
MIPDRVLMYASPFSYAGKVTRMKWAGYAIDEDMIRKYMGAGLLENDSLLKLQGFLNFSDNDQREFLDKKENLKQLLRVLFKIVEKTKANTEMLEFALLLINGIFEDKRSRIRELVAMQKTTVEGNHLNAVGILQSFLIQHAEPGNVDQNQMRDAASHTLAFLIQACDF